MRKLRGFQENHNEMQPQSSSLPSNLLPPAQSNPSESGPPQHAARKRRRDRTHNSTQADMRDGQESKATDTDDADSEDGSEDSADETSPFIQYVFH